MDSAFEIIALPRMGAKRHKNRADFEATSEPMRSTNPAERRRPSTDEKKIRRRRAKTSGLRTASDDGEMVWSDELRVGDQIVSDNRYIMYVENLWTQGDEIWVDTFNGTHVFHKDQRVRVYRQGSKTAAKPTVYVFDDRIEIPETGEILQPADDAQPIDAVLDWIDWDEGGYGEIVDRRHSSKVASVRHEIDFSGGGPSTLAREITLDIMSITDGDFAEFVLNGVGYTVYYDEQAARGDMGGRVHGDVIGEYALYRGVDGPMGLQMVTTQHVGPHGSSGYGNLQAKQYAAEQIAAAMAKDQSRRGGRHQAAFPQGASPGWEWDGAPMGTWYKAGDNWDIEIVPYDEAPGWVYLVTVNGETKSGRILEADGDTVEDAKDIAEAVLYNEFGITASRSAMKTTAVDADHHQEWRETEVAFIVLTGKSMSSVAESAARNVIYGHGGTVDRALQVALQAENMSGQYSLMDRMLAHDEATQRLGSRQASKRGSSMNTTRQRETEILDAMSRTSSLDEQHRLATDLDQVRRARNAEHEASHTLAWDDVNSIVGHAITPVVPHTMHTAGTDWVADLVEEMESNPSQRTSAMRTEARMFFSRTGQIAQIDKQEFTTQAVNIARRLGSQYGNDAHQAAREFLAETSRLAGFKVGEWTEADPEDASLHGSPSGEELTVPDGRQMDDSGIGVSQLPDPGNNPETFDTFAPVEDGVEPPLPEDGREGRRVIANTCEDCGHECNGPAQDCDCNNPHCTCGEGYGNKSDDEGDGDSKESRRVSPYDEGYVAGRAAGTWVIDAHTSSAQVERILQGIASRDPGVMGMQPSPSSDEIAKHADADVDNYKAGYSQGFWDEVEASARYLASSRRFASEPVADESGRGVSDLEPAEVRADEDWQAPAYPWEMDGTGQGAADVANVPTPGGEGGYPQPTARRRGDAGPFEGRIAAEDYESTHQCKLCGADIYKEQGVGWVDAQSGDNGGTYDFCPGAVQGDDVESGYGGHKPGPKTASRRKVGAVTVNENPSMDGDYFRLPALVERKDGKGVDLISSPSMVETVPSFENGIDLVLQRVRERGNEDVTLNVYRGGVTASRKTGAMVYADTPSALGDKLRSMGFEIRDVNYPGEGGLPEGGGQGYRKVEIKVNDGHWHQETVQRTYSGDTTQWAVNIPSWITGSRRKTAYQEPHPRRLGDSGEMCNGEFEYHVAPSGQPSMRCKECGFVIIDMDGYENYTGSRKTAEGQTCSVCGDSIAKGEGDDEGWHHNNGEKHDHEAKPNGNGNGDSKESARRRQAAFRQRVQSNLREGQRGRRTRRVSVSR